MVVLVNFARRSGRRLILGRRPFGPANFWPEGDPSLPLNGPRRFSCTRRPAVLSGKAPVRVDGQQTFGPKVTPHCPETGPGGVPFHSVTRLCHLVGAGPGLHIPRKVQLAHTVLAVTAATVSAHGLLLSSPQQGNLHLAPGRTCCNAELLFGGYEILQ